ncbi:MAG: type II toxin-antitoxin system prevent-host-death family antitoxin [Deltaproteobacteria bacterium]
MRTVTLETLKKELSEYVRIAAAGERVLISDRDRVVAELVPPAPGRGLTAERPGGSTLRQVLAGLEADRSDR